MARDEPRSELVLGPFKVIVTSDDTAAFEAATNFHPDAGQKRSNGTVPLAYLPTVLGDPSVKSKMLEALLELADMAGASFVHIHQDINLHHPMIPDRTYDLRVSCKRDGDQRFQIDSEIYAPGEGSIAQMLSKLVLARPEEPQ